MPEMTTIQTHDGKAEVPVGCTFVVEGLTGDDVREDIYYQGSDWSAAVPAIPYASPHPIHNHTRARHLSMTPTWRASRISSRSATSG